MIESLEDAFRAVRARRGGNAPRCVHVCKLAHEPYPDPATALVFLLFEDDTPRPSAVAKVARSTAADAGVHAEWRGVDLARRRLPDAQRRTVPENWARGEINGRAYGLWSAQPGRGEWHHTFPLREARRSGGRMGAALDWAAGMAAATAGGTISAREWLGPWADVSAELAAGGAGAAVLAGLHTRAGADWETRWPAALVHGDFFAGNLLFERDRVTGVLDWGGAEARGPAFVDRLCYEFAFALHAVGAPRALDPHTLRAIAELPAFRRERLAPGAPSGAWGPAARAITLTGRLLRELRAGPARQRAARAWMRLAAVEAGVDVSSLPGR